jgi:SAM-dependent methyltransferase
MPITPEPRREHPSTYFLQDRSNEEELKRLELQDRMAALIMGGLLPEQPDPTRFTRVLDVACGTGGWLIELAKAYPHMSQLVGVDISGKMIEYARVRAEAEHVSDRVEFHVMDALRMLEFPNRFFDLVNQRFGMAYMRTWDWPKLLQEFYRVARPEGIIRLTESDLADKGSSPALLQLFQLLAQALNHAGHLFAPEQFGIADQLLSLLQQFGYGLLDLQTRAYTLEYRAGTPAGQLYADDMQHAFRTAVPFLRKWTLVPDTYEDIYQQMIHEMQQPDFVATCHAITAWGIRPSGNALFQP